MVQHKAKADIARVQSQLLSLPKSKVIREKSRGEGSPIEQDTIENVSEPNFLF